MKFIFEVKIKPGFSEQQYTEAWEAGSAIIQQQPGAQGTRLHRKIGESGTLLAIASWESQEARDVAMQRLLEVDYETRATLDRHLEFCDFRLIGSYDEPDWVVEPLE